MNRREFFKTVAASVVGVAMVPVVVESVAWASHHKIAPLYASPKGLIKEMTRIRDLAAIQSLETLTVVKSTSIGWTEQYVKGGTVVVFGRRKDW